MNKRLSVKSWGSSNIHYIMWVIGEFHQKIIIIFFQFSIRSSKCTKIIALDINFNSQISRIKFIESQHDEWMKIIIIIFPSLCVIHTRLHAFCNNLGWEKYKNIKWKWTNIKYNNRIIITKEMPLIKRWWHCAVLHKSW
jgi:hypothetical protein